MSSPFRGGEFFVLGYAGTSPSREFLDLIQKHQIAGIIFFERNISSPSQLSLQIKAFQRLFSHALYFMIDQEGGRVNRIKSGIPTFPSISTFGETGDWEGAKKACLATAGELKKMGINVNLVPVADVARSAKNYISDRSFGCDPEKVSQFVRLAVSSVQAQGLLSCAKHFPGIGNLVSDPHKVLPENGQSAQEFWKVDFPPFQAAITSGVEMVMTTHVNSPALDKENPATFSPTIVNGILRGKLGFGGLIVSDDMEMDGIAKYFDQSQASQKAFLAGHDLILLCHSLDLQKQAMEVFKNDAESSAIPVARLEESASRLKSFQGRLAKGVSV